MKNNMNKMDESMYDEQETQLSEQSVAFLQMLKRRGIVEDETISDDKIRKADKEKRRHLYHNTTSILKNYRDITWALSTFPSQISQELEEQFSSLDALLDRVETEVSLENRCLESRLESVKKSRLLLDRIHEAMAVLKQKPKNGQMMYDIIYQTYMGEETLTHSELLYRLNLSSRHYYRLRTQAIHILSIRLWAAPGATLDSWLEVLSLLEVL